MKRFYLLLTIILIAGPSYGDVIDDLKTSYEKSKNEVLSIDIDRANFGKALGCSFVSSSKNCDNNQTLKVTDYTHTLRGLQDATSSYYDKIDKLEHPKEIDSDTWKSFKQYASDFGNYMNYDEAKLRNIYFEKGKGVNENDKTYEKALTKSQKDFNARYNKLKKDGKEDCIRELDNKLNNLKVDFSNISSKNPIYKKIATADWLECKKDPSNIDCINSSGAFYAALSVKDVDFEKMTVIQEDCPKLYEWGPAVIEPAKQLIGAWAAEQAYESAYSNGWDDEKTLKYYGLMKYFGGSSRANNPITQKYDALYGSTNPLVNPSFKMENGASINTNGTVPTNPFVTNPYTNMFSSFINNNGSNSMTNLNLQNQNLSSTTGTGRLNSDQGSQMFNNYAQTYSQINNAATNFNNNYSNYSQKLADQNSQLNNIISGNGADPSVYTKRVQSVNGTMKDLISGGTGRYSTSTDLTSTQAIRMKISELRDKDFQDAKEMIAIYEQIPLDEYAIQAGSMAEASQAAFRLAYNKSRLNNLPAEMDAIKQEIGVYSSNLYVMLDTSNMYASNDNKVYKTGRNNTEKKKYIN